MQLHSLGLQDRCDHWNLRQKKLSGEYHTLKNILLKIDITHFNLSGKSDEIIKS